MVYQNEDFFQAIGHISVFYATWDILLTTLYIRLLKDNNSISLKKIKDILTLNQKLHLVNKLEDKDVIDSSILKDFKANFKKLIEIGKERNRYIHDYWVFKEDLIPHGKIERHRIKGLGNKIVTWSEIELSIEDLYSFLNKVGDMQKFIGSLVDRLPKPQ